MQPIKSIYISYDEIDKELAQKTHTILENVLGVNVWIRNLDLRGGDLVAEILNDVMSEVRWFLIILSKQSLKSNWLQKELRLINIRWLESMNFNIVVINLDNAEYPRGLKIALESQYEIKLSSVENISDELLKLAIYIDEKTDFQYDRKIFINRGDELDRFIYSSKYYPIVFILGTAGIGKTSFITDKVALAINKRPIVVSFNRGRGGAIDYLMREILRKTYVEQPINSDGLTDTELISLVVDALKKRERYQFLFIDNLEFALSANHELPFFLINFLNEYLAKEIKTNIVIASTRVPNYHPSITSKFDVLHLDKLNDIFIKQCFDEWLISHHKHDEIMSSVYIDDLVKVTDGYPLAAQMLAASLKADIPSRIVLQSSEIKRLRLSLAAHILESLVQEQLPELDIMILRTMGLIDEPILFDDLISLKPFAQKTTQEVTDAIHRLFQLLILNQTDDDLLYVHSFIANYFRDQLNGKTGKETRDLLVEEIGNYSYEKVINLNTELWKLREKNGEDDEGLILITGEIFRYAVTASKFLRMAGKENFIKKLPIDIKSSIREMVLYFYQQENDYVKAIFYADKWLKMSPDDYEIKLYKARCHRNLGDNDNIAKAENTLLEIECSTHSRFFKDRILNEKGKIVIQQGDEDAAIQILKQAVENGATFPDIFINLSRLYLRKAKDFPEGSPQRYSYAKESINVLEIGRNAADSGSLTMGIIFLDYYVDALVELEDEVARPFLEQTLIERPYDGRLNYRMGEIQRKINNFSKAEEYAKISIDNGYTAAHITLSNVYFNQALIQKEAGDIESANKYFDLALSHAKTYKDLSPYSRHIVAITVLARIHRHLGHWDKVREIIEPFIGANDKYLSVELTELLIHEAEVLVTEKKWELALDKIQEARTIIRTVHIPLDSYSQELITKSANLYDEIMDRLN